MVKTARKYNKNKNAMKKTLKKENLSKNQNAIKEDP